VTGGMVAPSIMRWLKRCIWLTAWGVWVWLGFGLYRELPRELGKPIARFPAPQSSLFVHFVGETNLIAILVDNNERGTTVDAYDAETGRLIYSTPGPPSSNFGWANPASPMHPALIAKNVPAFGKGYSVFDLRTGKWRRATSMEDGLSSLGPSHPHKPWFAMLASEGQKPAVRRKFILIDWEKGSERTICEIPPNQTVVGGELLTANPDRLVFQLRPKGAVGSEASRGSWEVWNLNDPPTLEHRLTDLPVGIYPNTPSHGRIAFAFPKGSKAVEVYDLHHGRYLFANFALGERPSPPAKQSSGRRNEVTPPEISQSGQTVFGGDPKTAWHIDSGEIVWRQAAAEEYFVDHSRRRFHVLETWDRHWIRWRPRTRFVTEAIRDLDSARLIVRLRSTGDFNRVKWNAADSLGFSLRGEVYRLPPVNWPLLALCQAVLALPLVMLWVVLRLLSRRKLRRGTAVPRNSTM
jgi:hypothetical protein